MGGYVTLPTQQGFESHCSDRQLTDLWPSSLLRVLCIAPGRQKDCIQLETVTSIQME